MPSVYTIHNDINFASPCATEDTFHYRAIHPKNGNHKEVEYHESWVSYPGRYKGSDTFACLGPWIVTKDEIPDPHALDVSSAVIVTFSSQRTIRRTFFIKYRNCWSSSRAT